MPQTKKNSTFLYVVALICLLAVALFMFSKSNFFLVKNIGTEGLDQIAEDEVLRLLGTVKGENILLIDPEVLIQRVKLHPLVDQVSVKKKYPGTIILNIQERQPRALLLDGDRMVEVDSQAVVLRFHETWPLKDSPVITGINIPEIIGPGQKISDPGLEKGLLLIGQASEKLTKLLGEVHISSQEGVFIYLTNGVMVKMGHGEEYGKKLELLEKLLENEDFKKVEGAINYIDLTAGKPVLGR